MHAHAKHKMKISNVSQSKITREILIECLEHYQLIYFIRSIENEDMKICIERAITQLECVVYIEKETYPVLILGWAILELNQSAKWFN